MSGESAPKPRLVLCPKCWQLLPEPSNCDVYKCGGCGATLQAKKRRNRAVNSESSTNQTDAAPGNNALDLVSDDKQHSSGEQLVIPQENSLREKATSSSSGECSLDGNVGRGQNENGECCGEQLVISQGNDLRKKATTSSSSGECSLDGNGRSGHIENGECNGDQLQPLNLSDEDLENERDIYKLSHNRSHRVSNKGCSNELTHREIEVSSELKADNSVENANITNLQLEGEELSNGNMPLEGASEESVSALDKENPNNEKSALVGVKSEVDIVGSGLEGMEELNNGDLLPDGAEQELISESDGEVNNDKSALVGANSEVDITGSNKAAEEINNGNLLLKRGEEELNTCVSNGADIKNDQSALAGAKSDVDITEGASAAKVSSTENFVPEKESIPSVSPCKLEEGTCGNHVTSPNQRRKQALKNIHSSFDSVTSVDTCDTTKLINPSSELSGTLGEMPKSPTTRSLHAYDASVSSNDWVDERFPSQQLDSFENSCTVANGVSEGRTRKGKGLADSVLYGDLETQHQAYLPIGKHHVLKDSKGNQSNVPDAARHGYPHWIRPKRDEFPSTMPFHRSGSQSGYESGSPSNQTHDELYCSSSFLSPEYGEDPDQEKMKLLRMVYKLQDQLYRTSYGNGETNGRLSTGVSYMGKHVSTYHSHDIHEGRFYHGLDCPRCDGRCGHGMNWHQRHNFSRPYVSEVASSTHHVDYSCLHCCPQEWQCSAELPPRVLFQHEEQCRSHPGHSYCSSHCSYPSTTQWFMPSKLLYGHETKSGDQRQGAPAVKKYLREKQNSPKRHYRPVAGGAPFVTCHKCLKLLHLPADFLLFKRVCHQLKCGSCSEVLKFSLQNRSHIVSYAPNAIVLPSGDLDEQNEVINRSNLHSESHGNYYHSSHADPISYSDDCGHSVSKSYSSEGDPVSMTPFNSLHGSENDNPSVSHGSYEPITKKEKIGSRGPNTSEAPVETDELAVDSSNMSSGMDAGSQTKSSPLHQLMGYSSPSQVIRGIESIVEAKEPILNGENDQIHNSQQS